MQKPANAEEVTKEEEDVSVEDAEEFEEPGEITLNTLVTQFIQGRSIFPLLSIWHVAGWSYAVSHHFIVFVEENDMCELYTLINEQKLELTIISENSRQVSAFFALLFLIFQWNHLLLLYFNKSTCLLENGFYVGFCWTFRF